MSNVKDHKEKLVGVLYSKTSYNETEDGKSFPKNRVEIQLKEYSGKYQDKDGKYQDYSGKKIIIKNSKMEVGYDDEGNQIPVVKKKATYDGRVVDDSTQTSMSVEDFENIILESKDIYKKIEELK